MTYFIKTLCIGLCIFAVSCGNPPQKASDAAFTDSVAEALAGGGQINPDHLQWTREPAAFEIKDNVAYKKESVLQLEYVSVFVIFSL